ncbi:hypothetical protein N8I77_012833 [Diaporthe amygdali]|uniref:SprT-like domain-containing protein n=1 Tax=Phomopsis amygdali TaxID=1214568 RepID=A0AAD9S1T5_PHOAM|nr:hypothetical protein N8I77_012833 [Diaporthe amygdali]
MAHWVGAGGALAHSSGHTDDHGPHKYSSHRGVRLPVILHDDYYEYDSDEASLYPRPRSWDLDHDIGTPPDVGWSPKQPQFFVIREGTPALRGERDEHRHTTIRSSDGHLSPEPAPVACFMERTNSGRTILTEPDLHPSLIECNDFSPEEDKAAAARVRRYMSNPRRDVKRHERILRSLIHPKDHRGADFPLDDTALESIFSAADELFFQGRLSHRVQWEWSSSGQDDYSSRIIGTTALREAQPPLTGYETLIVLSSPLLKDTSYNRRLLISTFLHELIHSYLFICCGFKARHCGGHTQGFRDIAAVIDEWAGRGTLRLCDMEADLAHFKEVERSSVVESSQPRYYDVGCNGNFVDERIDTPWSTGPQVVFHAHGSPGSIGPPSNISTPLSSTSTLVGQGQRETFKTDEAVPRMLEMAAHTFAGSGTRGYY